MAAPRAPVSNVPTKPDPKPLLKSPNTPVSSGCTGSITGAGSASRLSLAASASCLIFSKEDNFVPSPRFILAISSSSEAFLAPSTSKTEPSSNVNVCIPMYFTRGKCCLLRLIQLAQ